MTTKYIVMRVAKDFVEIETQDEKRDKFQIERHLIENITMPNVGDLYTIIEHCGVYLFEEIT